MKNGVKGYLRIRLGAPAGRFVNSLGRTVGAINAIPQMCTTRELAWQIQNEGIDVWIFDDEGHAKRLIDIEANPTDPMNFPSLLDDDIWEEITGWKKRGYIAQPGVLFVFDTTKRPEIEEAYHSEFYMVASGLSTTTDSMCVFKDALGDIKFGLVRGSNGVNEGDMYPPLVKTIFYEHGQWLVKEWVTPEPILMDKWGSWAGVEYFPEDSFGRKAGFWPSPEAFDPTRDIKLYIQIENEDDESEDDEDDDE